MASSIVNYFSTTSWLPAAWTTNRSNQPTPIQQLFNQQKFYEFKMHIFQKMHQIELLDKEQIGPDDITKDIHELCQKLFSLQFENSKLYSICKNSPLLIADQQREVAIKQDNLQDDSSYQVLNPTEFYDQDLLKLVKTHPNLTSLDLTECIFLTNEGVSALSSLQKLQSLNLNGCIKINDMAMQNLITLNLRSLAIGGTAITDNTLIAMGMKLLFKELLSFDLSGAKSSITLNGFQNLAKCTQLKSLNLSNVVLDDDKLKAVGELKHLELLNLSMLAASPVPSRYTTKGLHECLKHLTKLKVLNFAYAPIDSDVMQSVGKLSNLNELYLNGCLGLQGTGGLEYLTGLKNLKILGLKELPFLQLETLVYLEQFENLSILYLSNNQTLSHLDERWNFLAKLQKLEWLELKLMNFPGMLSYVAKALSLKNLSLHAHRPSDQQDWETLTSLTELQSLSLESCNIADEHLAKLAHTLQKLYQLDLTDTENISSLGLKSLTNSSALRELYLDYKTLAESDLAIIGQLTQLSVLSLQRVSSLSDAGILNIKSLTNLQSINLIRNDSLTDQCLDTLIALPHLQSIALYPQITNQGLLKLQAIKENLSFLIFTECNNLTDVGLMNLAHLTHLQEITIHSCQKITQQGVRKLSEALPNTRIAWPGY